MGFMLKTWLTCFLATTCLGKSLKSLVSVDEFKSAAQKNANSPITAGADDGVLRGILTSANILSRKIFPQNTLEITSLSLKPDNLDNPDSSARTLRYKQDDGKLKAIVSELREATFNTESLNERTKRESETYCTPVPASFYSPASYVQTFACNSPTSCAGLCVNQPNCFGIVAYNSEYFFATSEIADPGKPGWIKGLPPSFNTYVCPLTCCQLHHNSVLLADSSIVLSPIQCGGSVAACAEYCCQHPNCYGIQEVNIGPGFVILATSSITGIGSAPLPSNTWHVYFCPNPEIACNTYPDRRITNVAYSSTFNSQGCDSAVECEEICLLAISKDQNCYGFYYDSAALNYQFIVSYVNRLTPPTPSISDIGKHTYVCGCPGRYGVKKVGQTVTSSCGEWEKGSLYDGIYACEQEPLCNTVETLDFEAPNQYYRFCQLRGWLSYLANPWITFRMCQ